MSDLPKTKPKRSRSSSVHTPDPASTSTATLQESASTSTATMDEQDSMSGVGPEASSEKNTKIFNDPIHGTMEFHALCVKIIDTPQFQRMRYLKQLGGTYYVFPGASHNRFEHSLGVCHLAGELLRQLRSRQPELDITDKDILCVEIAGLCHDLGHGAFSHLFDMNFIPRITGKKDWKHEIASVNMLQRLIEVNGLKPEFEKYLLFDNEVNFIEKLINSPELEEVFEKNKEWSSEMFFVDKSKSFLYEIVANQRNSVDVDKWEYFARDAYYLGIQSNFDHLRYMKFVRVIEHEGYRQICCRDKEIGNLYGMFNLRATLHRRAYQHKNTKIIEYMIAEILELADDFLTFRGEDNDIWRLSETIHSMAVYTQVHDDVLHMIRYSGNPRLVEVQAKLRLNGNGTQENGQQQISDALVALNTRLERARKLLDRIEKRQLYTFIGEAISATKEFKIIPADWSEKTQHQKEKAIGEGIAKELLEDEKFLEKSCLDSIVVQLGNFDYGNKDKDPVQKVRFYKKFNDTKAFPITKEEVSHMLLETFSEQYIRVYLRDITNIEKIKECFVRYCDANELHLTRCSLEDTEKIRIELERNKKQLEENNAEKNLLEDELKRKEHQEQRLKKRVADLEEEHDKGFRKHKKDEQQQN